MIGRTLGHYKILDRLGTGGMGVVWLAEDLELGRRVAIKLLRDDVAGSPERRARFEREARSVAALNHPNIVTLYAVEEADGQRFLAMEYVAGRTLDELLQSGPLAASEVLRIGIGVAAALEEAHRHGIVHRDLKPSNVLLGPDGRIKVVDFGLARSFDSESFPAAARPRETSLTQEGLAVGTLHYMSPEQLQNRKVDQRTDLFALGIVLYEMATGTMPFPGESAAQVITSVLRDPPRRMEGAGVKLPPQILDLIQALLAKDPDDRPASAGEVREALEAAQLLFHSETAALPASKSLAVPGLRRASPLPWRRGRVAIAAAIGSAALVALWLALRPEPAPAPNPQEKIPALAVLPLANYSAEPDWVVDGMTDGLIGAIARIDTIRVISRQSAMHYKDSKKRLPDIAAEIGVDYVLEGSLRRDGDGYRLQAQLFRPRPEQQLWSGSFARGGADVLMLHAEVARAVAAALHIELSPTAAERFQTVRTVDPAAYDAYLRGRHLVDQGRPETVHKAREYFEQALALDPTFALAHVGLADAYGYLAYLFEDPVANAGRQEVEARRAIELDPGSAEAHALLSENLRYFSWDWTAAEVELRRAIELGPNDARVRRMYWGLLASLGRFAEARAQIGTAIALDPLSAAAAGDLAYLELFERRYAEAEAAFRRALEIDAAFPYAHAGLWVIYDRLDREPQRTEALRAWLLGMEEKELLAELDAAPDGTPYEEIARRLGRRAEELSRTRRLPLGLGAALLASAGELDAAEAWLERAYRERDPELVWLAMDPGWAPLRNRPTFRRLLADLKLPSTGG